MRTRAQLEAVINAGGVVRWRDGIVRTIADLPSQEELDASAYVPETVDFDEITGDPADNEALVEFVEENAGGSSDVKVYRALLTQNGTDAPVATVLENTLGGEVVWSYDDESSYLGTSPGGFPDGRTFITTYVIPTDGGDGHCFRRNANSINVTTPGDSTLNQAAIEVLVYPEA